MRLLLFVKVRKEFGGNACFYVFPQQLRNITANGGRVV